MPYKYKDEDPRWYKNYAVGIRHGRRESSYKDPLPGVIKKGHIATPYHHGYEDGNFNRKVHEEDPSIKDAAGDSSYSEIYHEARRDAERTAATKRATATDNGRGHKNLTDKQRSRS